MAPEDNWLSFSLSPMAMLSSSTSQPQMLQSTMKFDGSSSADSQQYYFFDNFYANGWPDTKPQVMYAGENQVQEVAGQNIADSSIFTTFIDSHIKQQSAPKLEDFLGGDSASLVRYSDSQTETQDSELTHIYGQSNSAYFNDQQDLKTIAAFQAFSTNSGSEVDDSASVARTQLGSAEFAGQCFESRNDLAYSQCPTGALSLGVNTNTTTHSSEKAIVAVESGSCKKIADTFGQRTSIYRGVTRYSLWQWNHNWSCYLKSFETNLFRLLLVGSQFK